MQNTTSSSNNRTPANQTVASVGLAGSQSSMRTRTTSGASSLAEAQPTRTYAPSTTSTAIPAAAPAVVQHYEEEVSDDDEHSIGGSSVEEDGEHNTSTLSAVEPHHSVVTSETHVPVAVSSHQTTHTEQPQMAESIGLPTYGDYGAAHTNHGYVRPPSCDLRFGLFGLLAHVQPIEKKTHFGTDPIDHEATASSVPHIASEPPISQPTIGGDHTSQPTIGSDEAAPVTSNSHVA